MGVPKLTPYITLPHTQSDFATDCKELQIPTLVFYGIFKYLL